MRRISYLKILCLLLFFQLFSCDVFSQVKYAFSKDTLEISGGQTFSNLLRVTNPYSETVVLTQDKKELQKGMIALPDSIVLKAGESRVFPVKYIADRQTINSNIQSFTVRLLGKSTSLSIQQSASFVTQLTDVGGITLGTEEDEVYLSQLSNQAQVVVRCANNGFVPVTFKLLLTGIPDGLEFTGQTMNLTLQPGSQQLLPFLARNKEGSRNSSDFTVTIQAMDQSNNQLAVKVLRVVRVTSARRLSSGMDQSSIGVLPNSISLRYGSMSSNSSYYQLQANGKVKTGENQQLEYRLNADEYRQFNGNGINIYNTYVDYQAKSWGVKVGNIYDNIDFQMSGRGVKATAKLNKEGNISFYGIQNNYLLYDQLQAMIPGAKTYAVDYSLDDPSRWSRRLTILRSNDPTTGVTASQASLKTGYRWKDGEILGFEGGVSLENKDYAQSASKKGLAAGINYGMNNEDYQFLGNVYYSDPYYTGLRRGLFLTDARLTRKLGDARSLFANVNIQVNRPKYQDSINSAFNGGINKNAMYIYGVGYNTRAGHFYMGFNPYFMQQHLTAMTYLDFKPVAADWRSSSVRFSANMSYSGRIHSFSVNTDYGYTYINSSERPPAPFHSLKITSSYTMPVIGFNSYIQINPYYLSDALSSTGANRYRLYSFGPNVHFVAFKNSLNVQAGGMYNYYGFTNSNNYSVTGNLKYMMKGHWSLTGDVLYTISKQNIPGQIYDPVTNARINPENIYSNNRQIRVGIEKQFGGQSSAGTKKLELTYYEDHNSNGIRDPGEDAVPGILVKINGEAALTNSKGKVEFRDMKKEAYSVAVTNTKGWSLQDPTTVFLDKNKQLEIPLVKTQALNGCVKPIATKYLDKSPVLAGIRINAIDPNGRIHQALTDDQGKFCFYLPRNNYTVYIETEGMPFSIENSKEQVSLSGAPIGMLTFLFRDETRKVGITRF